jgi:hypothetical protein
LLLINNRLQKKKKINNNKVRTQGSYTFVFCVSSSYSFSLLFPIIFTDRWNNRVYSMKYFLHSYFIALPCSTKNQKVEIMINMDTFLVGLLWFGTLILRSSSTIPEPKGIWLLKLTPIYSTSDFGLTKILFSKSLMWNGCQISMPHLREWSLLFKDLGIKENK